MSATEQPEREKYAPKLDRRLPLMIYCWLNVALGAFSILFGALILLKPGLIFGGFAAANAGFLLVLGAIFLIFGALRIVNGTYHIRRLNKLPK